MANLFVTPYQTTLDQNGYPISGARLYFYLSGTSTLASTYADAELTTPLTNPVVADAAGRHPAIYLDPEETYRVRITDAIGTTIRDIDPYTVGESGAFVEPPFLQTADGAVSRPKNDKLSDIVSVLDFGAKGFGGVNDTAAFTAAIATGKTVIVPASVFDGMEFVRAQYSVADIPVVDRMHIRGEKDGWNNAPLLVVRSTGASAFLNSATEILFYITMENLACGAATGVTGASFYKQTRQDRYTAFPTFRNIETHLSLRVSYVISPIFALWDRCRDGGEGSPTDSEHSFIQALALSYGQRDQFNVIRIKDSIINNAFGTAGAVVASYGVTWNIENTDFEALRCSAFVAYNIDQLRFTGCWFEGVRALNTIQLRNYSGTPASSHAVIDTCNFVFNGTGGVEVAEVIGIDSLSSADLNNCTFNLVPAGVKLTFTGERLSGNGNPRVLSGAGAATFLLGTHAETYENGRRLMQGASDNAVAGMTMQTKDGFSAPLGFLSRANIAVGTAFVTIATAQTGIGGHCSITASKVGDGSQGVWEVRFRDGYFRLLNYDAADDETATTPVFQMVGTSLQMKTTTGALNVFTTLLH